MGKETIEQKYWNRIGHIEIEGAPLDSYGSDTYGLDFKFNISKIGGFYTEFDMSILGLTHDSVNALTVWNPSDVLKNSRQVKIFAGYETDGKANEIASGYVWEAFPTPPPEMWLNIKCMKYLPIKEPLDHLERFYGTPRELFVKIAEIMGFGDKYLWQAPEKITIGGKQTEFVFFEFSDFTKDQLIYEFANFTNLNVYENNGVLIAKSKYGYRFTNPDPDRTPVIDRDNGLLALGNIDINGMTIKTRLNDTYDLFDWVRIDSELIPKASGYYYVIEKRHIGHMRGKEWYTEIKAMRKV